MYNKRNIDFIKKHHPHLTRYTTYFDDFYNHIVSISMKHKDLLEDGIETPNNEHQHIDLIKEIENISVDISIIIICKNEERVIQRCLDSISKQTDNQDEIILIDTGSTDNTIPIVLDHYPMVKVKHLEWKDNFAEVRNYGIKVSSKKWIFFIDADEHLEENSLHTLKHYLKVIEFLGLEKICVNPIIANSNGHIVRGVRRIFRGSEEFQYFGSIHEELRLDIKKYGQDINEISFDNVILHHDGYETHVMEEKNKIKRNTKLLKDMVVIEEKHPRWVYFYARDGQSILGPEEYLLLLKRTIELCHDNKYYEQYKIRAISDLIRFHIDINDSKKAKYYITQLKELVDDFSDVFYYETLIKINELKREYAILLEQSINYRNSKSIEFGSINSNLFHIDMLIAILFFEIGEYQRAFKLLSKLEDNKYEGFKDKFIYLSQALKEYIE